MAKHITYTVNIGKDKAGKRMDLALAESLPTLSRNRIKLLMEAGCVFYDDGRLAINPSAKVRDGDVVTLEQPPPVPAVPIAQYIPLEIVYEDKNLLVIDKPSGLVVHPGAGHRDGTLVNALLYHCRGELSGIGGVSRPGIVHRLDKDTSGLIVAAKTDIAHQALAKQFSSHEIERAYKALVWGVPSTRSGLISGQIGRSKKNRKKMAIVAKGGKFAKTHYQVLRIFDNVASLIECRLETGRTHQIRVHLSSVGHPVIGDPVYGRGLRGSPKLADPSLKDVFDNLNGQLLHANILGFLHPITKRNLSFVSTKPNRISEIIEIMEW